LTFDLLENLSRTGTNHDHDQPSHLRIKHGKTTVPYKSFTEFAGLEERFCPAKVYEFVKDAEGKPVLQINAQNCIHCKTCSIKMIDEYIDWNVPEGGQGPE
jgi:electron-transferring-flavoprotein dehydrogenase